MLFLLSIHLSLLSLASSIHPIPRISLSSSLFTQSFIKENNDYSSATGSLASSRHLTAEDDLNLEYVGDVTTFAGVNGSSGSTNGIGTNAQFDVPRGVAISPDGVYALVGDRDNHLIRHIVISTAHVTTLAGLAGSWGSTNGIGTLARFRNPHGVSISADGVYALVADRGNHLIRHIVISTASVTTLTGVAGSLGSTNGMGSSSRFNSPEEVSISPDGVYALVGDIFNHQIRRIIISTASVTTLAGVNGSSGSSNGIGTNSRFRHPHGVAIFPDGVYALVADYGNHLIRRIVISTASVTTLAGVAGSAGSSNGIGTNGRFHLPNGISISPDGMFALVSSPGNHLIRRITISTACVTTLAGSAGVFGSTNGIGTNARLNYPNGISISLDGLYALVADHMNHLIRHIIIKRLTDSPSLVPSSAPSLFPTSDLSMNGG